jgi:hypothetical protein
MKFPETDPFTYRSWIEEEWHNVVLEELEKLLLYVRRQPISGLLVGKIRGAVFVPFGGPDSFNRKASLLLAEIEANQEGSVDEAKFDREYQLSGLKRPISSAVISRHH